MPMGTAGITGITPALASTRSPILDPTPPDAVVSTLATPAFDPPLFKLLRPPK
jgi:hypothetical protein